MELNREEIKNELKELLNMHCFHDYKYSEPVCGAESIAKALDLINELTDENERLTSLCVSKDVIIGDMNAENERLREHNIVLEQKIMLLGCDEQYFFKAQVKGE